MIKAYFIAYIRLVKSMMRPSYQVPSLLQYKVHNNNNNNLIGAFELTFFNK